MTCRPDPDTNTYHLPASLSVHRKCISMLKTQITFRYFCAVPNKIDIDVYPSLSLSKESRKQMRTQENGFESLRPANLPPASKIAVLLQEQTETDRTFGTRLFVHCSFSYDC
jgi:hypothetical protein